MYKYIYIYIYIILYIIYIHLYIIYMCVSVCAYIYMQHNCFLFKLKNYSHHQSYCPLKSLKSHQESTP